MFKDYVTKWIVALKRHPHNIPLVMLIICCMIYTFQLTAHSNASMYVSNREIALYVFIITLCSILIIFSFVNAYAKRGKHKPLMLAVVYLLAGLQLFLDAVYLNIIHYETVLRDNPVPVIDDIAASTAGTRTHFIMLALSVLAIITLPVYRKLLQKIKTSIQDDEADYVLDTDEKLAWDDGEIL
ncbi:MAG: hypothetical protein FWE91_03085 [Defluviitaleaceae bacterium]|nr:hypothetical protein [Defluviitaleaceae bacterium]MCL2835911.1 hypothetical protein [Defluviitaleaceae bacterium]